MNVNSGTPDRILRNYCKLVEAVVLKVATPKGRGGKKDPRTLAAEKAANRRWILDSKLLHHYCDAFGYDFEVIQRRLLEINL